jgi:hypothetical protein
MLRQLLDQYWEILAQHRLFYYGQGDGSTGRALDRIHDQLFEFVHNPSHNYSDLLRIQIVLEQEIANHPSDFVNVFMHQLAKEAKEVMPVIGRSHMIFLNQLRTLLDEYYKAWNKGIQNEMGKAQTALFQFIGGREWDEEALLVLRVTLWREVNAHPDVPLIKQLAIWK